MVSATEPVNIGGKYMISVGHDLLLHELIERTIGSRVEGTHNILLRDDGRLLAHPQLMDAIQAQNGSLPIEKASDANLLRIFDLVKGRSPAMSSSTTMRTRSTSRSPGYKVRAGSW